jgi:hypothetical protein
MEEEMCRRRLTGCGPLCCWISAPRHLTIISSRSSSVLATRIPGAAAFTCFSEVEAVADAYRARVSLLGQVRPIAASMMRAAWGRSGRRALVVVLAGRPVVGLGRRAGREPPE